MVNWLMWVSLILFFKFQITLFFILFCNSFWMVLTCFSPFFHHCSILFVLVSLDFHLDFLPLFLLFFSNNVVFITALLSICEILLSFGEVLLWSFDIGCFDSVHALLGGTTFSNKSPLWVLHMPSKHSDLGLICSQLDIILICEDCVILQEGLLRCSYTNNPHFLVFFKFTMLTILALSLFWIFSDQ